VIICPEKLTVNLSYRRVIFKKLSNKLKTWERHHDGTMMASDGSQLEGIVAFVEETLLPQGFNVRTREKIYNDDNVQIAEFDIEIRGKVGSTDFVWLIECRDRPGNGTAPASWIEQLVGRRIRFGFNKVTAVLTTGFSRGAIDFAKEQGIELREVRAITPEEFSPWLAISTIPFVENVIKLDHAIIVMGPEESEDRKAAILKEISRLPLNARSLKSCKSGELTSPVAAFSGAISGLPTLFSEIEPNGPGRQIKLRAEYTNDEDHFVIDTSLGTIRVREILFYGEISVREKLIPLAITAEYLQKETGEPISQVASFEPHLIQGMMLSLEMHRIAQSGEMHIVLRKLPDPGTRQKQ
jgi:hypothetical protein